ncbi:hypothetical protein BTO00_01795 [Vibrio campbellii]|nr:hypothetical protein BTO00_01795 [Vibrio campbellii]
MVASASDNIIPTMYDYAIPWKQSIFKHKVRDTIPLACNKTPSIIINEDRKLTIMHGINREGFKGTKKIMEALERIKKEFGSEVNVLYPEKLPLNDYLKLMADVDIAIDQCKGNSYGMNAIFSMFSGHIVLAPANDKFIKDMKLEFCPVVSIGNDSNDIYLKLKCLILNKKNIYDMKVRTQEYAVDLHSSINVARRMKLFI